MRIALMTNNYKPFVGGVPISVERLKKGLEEAGHEVTVFAPAYTYMESEEENVIRYGSFHENRFSGVCIPNSYDPKIEQEFCKKPYDIIHVQHPMLIGKTAVRLSKKYKIPLIFTYHTRYEHYLNNFKAVRILEKGAGLTAVMGEQAPLTARLEAALLSGLHNKVTPAYLNRFFKHCHFIFSPTAGMREYLHDTCSVPYEKMDILPTGLREEAFLTTEALKQATRKKYHAEGIPLLLSVSRLSHEKNVEFLLESIAKVKKLSARPFRLLLVGDGPEKTALEEKCQTLGIAEEVIFAGKIPNEEIAPYYAASDVFVFASKTETQGIVILEAFAGATPVCALDASGVSDLVTDGQNGRLCGEDTEIFARNILRFIDGEEDMEALSCGAYEAALTFREEAVAGKAVALYNKVIAEYESKKNAGREYAMTAWWKHLLPRPLTAK